MKIKLSIFSVFLFALLGLFPTRGLALAPHESLLLVNQNSSASKQIANHYIALRGIPEPNVVYLDIPTNAGIRISYNEYRSWIYEPTVAAVKERNLQNQILAWILSDGIPHSVSTSPVTSLQGMNFVRLQVPDQSLTHKGTYQSVYFAGPKGPDTAQGETLSLPVLAQKIIRNNMNPPIAGMSLAYTGPGGTSVPEAINCLKRGVESDFTQPNFASVYITTNKDIRTACRIWQFESVMQDFVDRKRPIGMTPGRPPDVPLVGWLNGTANFKPQGVNFVKGAIGDHLTSFGCAFHIPLQTKATDLIKAGAVAAGGAIDEPMSIWTKFPHARIFSHYQRGVTVLEAYQLSLSCPMQYMVIGEPFARPFAPKLELDVDVKTEDEMLHLNFNLKGSKPGDAFLYMVFLDGSPVTTFMKIPKVSVPLNRVPFGSHELRVLAFQNGNVIHWARWMTEWTHPGTKMAPKITSFAAKAEVDYHQKHSVDFTPIPGIKTYRLMQGRRELDAGETLTFDPKQAGKGPVTLRVDAVHKGTSPLRGPSVQIKVQ